MNLGEASGVAVNSKGDVAVFQQPEVDGLATQGRGPMHERLRQRDDIARRGIAGAHIQRRTSHQPAAGPPFETHESAFLQGG